MDVLTMTETEMAAFARFVVAWFAGELDRALVESRSTFLANGPLIDCARADLLEAQRGVVAVERALAGVAGDAPDGEMVAGHFCVQLVSGFCALFEWHHLRIEGGTD